jgi:PPOX class probable F420-dependent enzyme
MAAPPIRPPDHRNALTIGKRRRFSTFSGIPRAASRFPGRAGRAALDDARIARLDRESYISLATFRRDGRAVETPVWFAASRGRLYVFSEARAGKMKRLRNSPRLRVAACNVRGRVHGEWIEGVGRRIDDPATIERAYDALLAKYGWLMRITNFVSRLAGRIEGRAIIEIELGP